MNLKQIIADYLYSILQPLGVSLDSDKVQSLLETPKDTKMGDFAFPCFLLAKELKKAPPMIAKQLAESAQSLPTEISEIQAAGPYLNVFINKANLASDLIPSILSGTFTQARKRNQIKTMIEYSQPNTHKGFHVGHTRNVSLGDALVRIREWAGDEVVAANYIGDVGTHIAKCLWFYKKSNLKYEDYQDKMSRGEFLGMLYSEADKLMDFYQLTKAPHPFVVTAKIEKIENHPKQKNWKIVTVTDGQSSHQVVCGAKAYSPGDIVALATLGARINGKKVETSDKDGINSEGMLCTPSEISLGEETEKLYLFDTNIPLGKEIADYFQIDKSIESAAKEILKRENEVSQVLQNLEKDEPEIHQLWQKTRKWSLDDFNEIYQWLGARFDHFFYESDVAKPGKEIVKEYLEKGVFKKDQGAVGVDLSKYNLPFLLVLKSDGTGLYSTKDLALAKVKFDQFGIDQSIYVVDTAQSLHFQQVFKTLELMGYKQASKCHHLSYGMVMLPDGKMSSRKGNVILLSELKSLLAEQIYKDFLKSYEGKWDQEEILEATRKISLATIKYGMLNQDSNKNIIFDLKDWASRTGNTGPYLMYAYARTRSILKEVESKFPLSSYENCKWDLLNHEKEEKLLNKMSIFPEVVQKAAERFEPQILCIYLYELSKDFSRMYDHCSVLHAETEDLRNARAHIVSACGTILKTGLGLLGIETLERM